jgi:hypothetical protein
VNFPSTQLELWTQILEASKTLQSDQIVCVSEYLGFLPFGVYHWLECAGENISDNFPTDWQKADLAALEGLGCLVVLETWQNPDDQFDTRTTYKVCPEKCFSWSLAFYLWFVPTEQASTLQKIPKAPQLAQINAWQPTPSVRDE